MTALEQARKLTYACTRCGAHAPDANLCSSCAPAARERTRTSMAKRRAFLRELGLCVDCLEPSLTYRCAACRKPADEAPVHTLDLPPAIAEI